MAAYYLKKKADNNFNDTKNVMDKLTVEETLLFADSSVYKEQPITNAQADLHLCCSHMA